MGLVSLKEGLVGTSIGYQYAGAKHKEEEVKQGKNYYLSSLFLTVQQSELASLAHKITQVLPPFSLKTPVKVFCQLTPFICFPLNFLFASVRQGDYPTVARVYNYSRFSLIKAPEKLGTWTVKVINLFMEHGGKVLRIAMLTGAIALIALGNVAFGVGVLASIAYEAIDSAGFVPRRISLFMETYMPILIHVGTLLSGIVILQVMAAVSLLSHVSSTVKRHVHETTDLLIRQVFPRLKQTPALKAINAPVVKKTEMSASEIYQILNGKEENYEINPAHCSKWVSSMQALPEDRHFERYLTLFDKIDWEDKYALVFSKLKDDDRFIDFLFTQFPKVDKQTLKTNVAHYIQQLAAQQNVPPQKYLATWLRQQMVAFVSVIQSKKRVEGSQQHLDQAIQESAKLLPYLTSLKQQVELEDCLLHLAVEGGDYCGRGIKRATHDLMRGILQRGFANKEERNDPLKAYERQLQQSLQNKRHMLLLQAYQNLMQDAKMPKAIYQDVHGFDVYRNLLALGFYPMTQYEYNEIDFLQLVTWEFYSSIRQVLYKTYRKELDETIQETELEFANYMRQTISQNKRLSAKEKEEILEIYTERNQDKWSAEETSHRFHRLLLVMLGVMRYTATPVIVDTHEAVNTVIASIRTRR